MSPSPVHHDVPNRQRAPSARHPPKEAFCAGLNGEYFLKCANVCYPPAPGLVRETDGGADADDVMAELEGALDRVSESARKEEEMRRAAEAELDDLG